MEALHPDRAAVEAQIRTAFAGVTLGKGMSLRQAQVADRYGEGVTEAEYESLPRGETTNSWADVSFSELEHDCVAHLDNEGLRYYLPALMLSLLSNYDPASMRVIGTISALYPPAIGPERRYTYLTDDQHQAVACFVEALPRLAALTTEDSKLVSRALRNYWGRFASRGHVEVVRYLLSVKADCNIAESNGYTPLHWAASHGNLETMKALRSGC